MDGPISGFGLSWLGGVSLVPCAPARDGAICSALKQTQGGRIAKNRLEITRSRETPSLRVFFWVLL